MQLDLMTKVPNWKYKDFVDNQFVIARQPQATVRDQLKEAVKKLRVGNLMVLLQIGSMPHELTLKNIDLFAREVKPHFRDMWDDEWENQMVARGGSRKRSPRPRVRAPRIPRWSVRRSNRVFARR